MADSGETRQAIAIGPRIVASSGFDALYREGMGLIEAVAAYLDAEGRVESRMLPREAGFLYATESMRLTTRLMQLASWLLLQRAVNEGDADRLVISWPRPTLVAHAAAAGSLGRIGVAPVMPRRLLRHLPVMPLGRDARMQVVHADDVADAIARIIETRLPGPVNVAAPDVLGPREIAAPLGGRPLRLPGAFLLRLTDALWAAHLWPLEGGWLRMAAEVPLVGTGRAERELGWHARHSGADTWRELVDAMANGLGGDTPAMRRRSVLDDALRLFTQGPVTRRTRT